MRIKPLYLVTALAVALAHSLAAQVAVNGMGSLVTNSNATTPGSSAYTYTLANPTSAKALVVGYYNDNGTAVASATFDANAATKFATTGRTAIACYFLPQPAPASVVIKFTLAAAGAPTAGMYVYELAGVDTTGGAAAVDAGTGAAITTTGDGKFVVNFKGINNSTGAGTVPAATSIIPSANAAIFDMNGGGGGGALCRGYALSSGTAGAKTLGWTAGADGEVSMALVQAGNPDADGDGLLDAWETARGLNVGVNDAADDADTDGSSNLVEFQAGTAPNDPTWKPGNAKLAHRWSFTGDLTDSAGGSNAQIVNTDTANTGLTSTQNAGDISLTGGAKATSDFISLGSNLLSNLQSGGVQPVTIELWATQNLIQNWSRIFNFGTDDGSNPGPNESLRMTWTQGTDINADQVAWEGMAASYAPGNSPYVAGVPFHIVMTVVPAVFSNGAITTGAKVTWYSAPAAGSQLAGHPLYAAKGTFNSASDLRALLDSACTLGRSYYGDNTASASYDEVRIWKGELSETERELFQLIGPDTVDRADVDQDGFPDAWETARFGNTTTAAVGVDSDTDGINDETEFAAESNPNDAASTLVDSDKDNMADTWEIQYFKNLLQNGDGDPDNDYCDNELEETHGTQPNNAASSPDTDGDSIADGWEYRWFPDLTVADATTNSDGDFDTDAQEFVLGTNPTSNFSGRDLDTDGIALTATDGFGQSSFNAGTNWTGAAAPIAGKNYLVPSGLRLRTPDVGASTATFNGSKLSIAGELGLKGDGSTFNANYVFANPSGTASIINIVNAGGTVTLGGTLEIKTSTTVNVQNGPITFAGIVSGAGGIDLTDSAATPLTPVSVLFDNAANTYTGDIVLRTAVSLIVNGVLTPGIGSVFHLTPATSGVTNSIGGTGSIHLAGSLNIDLAAAVPSNGATWQLVTTPVVTFDPGFTVTGSGFVPDAGTVGARVWTSDGHRPPRQAFHARRKPGS